MVEANPQGDGIHRPIHYANFRKDKAPSPGYSAELISKRVDAEYYDNLDAAPRADPECDTLLKFFKKNVAALANEPFLGTREPTGQNDEKGKPIFADYTWQSFARVNGIAENLAKGLMIQGLCQEVDGEDKKWRFCGIWAKNRWEWTATLLACMHYSVTTVGFYDAMSVEQVDYIINQTEMATIVCSEEYAQKLVTMKKNGAARQITALVVMTEVPASLLQEAQQQGIEVHSMDQLIKIGSEQQAPAFREPTKDDIYIFSYTSGTTGDPKGVKLSHNNVLSNSRCTIPRVVMNPGETLISYLPYTHSFEQALFGFTLMQQLKVGFFSGDPARLIEDCGMLKPDFFPSVPRLYNRIYGRLKGRLEEATGCKRWLANKAVAAKTAAYNANGAITHGCYDALVFKKMKALLGGQVRAMVTGSAPIDKAVIDFLKICFCCPIVEGYGLTESAAASCIMDVEDPVTGHVGGPVESVKFRLKDLPEMSYLSTDKPYPRGEICMYGPSIFKGYYKRPDKTAEAFDQEGWFLTGDVAQIYPNGSVKIIDRSKNIFKLSQGEYIAPEKIENIMVLSQAIAQCFLYGDSFQNACVSIIIPEEEWVNNWAKTKGLTGQSFQQLCQNADLKKEIQDDMLRLATANKLSSLEKPKQITLWHELCSVENNLITSTFKLKRNEAKVHFKPQIDAMYEKVKAAEEAAAAKAGSRA